MVTLGDEGMGLNGTDNSYPYTYAEGTDFAKFLTIDTLDFGTIHMYPSHCKFPRVCSTELRRSLFK